MSNKLATSITFYTDGSTAPTNPGPSGYGAYGLDNENRVHNLYGPVALLGTNNMAELEAMIRVLLYVNEHPNINELIIHADSKYVLDGIRMIPKWRNRDWVTMSGSPVKNKGFWVRLSAAETEARAAGVKIKYNWCKGHSGNKGNDQADTNADLGRLLVLAGTKEHIADVTDLAVVELPKVKKVVPPRLNPLLTGKRWYFKSNSITTIPDGRLFYTTTTYEDKEKEIGKKGKNIGKRASDTHFSILLTDTPIKALDTIRDLYNNDITTAIKPIVTEIAALTRKDTWASIFTDITKAISLSGSMIVDSDNNILSEIRHPPKLVFKLDKVFDHGLSLLSLYEKDNITTIDITDHVLTSDAKNIQSVNKTFTQKTRMLELQNQPVFTNTTGMVKLNVGIDLPTRNSINAMIKSKVPVRISLLIWEVTDLSYRCATVVEQGSDISIFYTTDSNFKLRLK